MNLQTKLLTQTHEIRRVAVHISKGFTFAHWITLGIVLTPAVMVAPMIYHVLIGH